MASKLNGQQTHKTIAMHQGIVDEIDDISLD